MERSALLRMDNVGIVVASLDDAIPFFEELGLKLEGRAHIEGAWAGRITGLGDQQVEIAMLATPDGHSRLELSQFIRPDVVADHRRAPVNALGYLRVMFAVTKLDELLGRLRGLGAELVGEVVQYENAYRLCYVRGPEGILVGLAEPLLDPHQQIQKAYAAFNARDIDTALATFHPNVEWPKAFEGGYAQGHEAIREYWTRQWTEIDPNVEPTAIKERPDGTLVVTVHQRVKDLDGGVIFDGTVRHIYTMQDGLFRRMDIETGEF